MSIRKKIIVGVLVILILSLIIPIIAGCLYAIPAADDFSNTLGWRSYEGNHFLYPFIYLANIYKIWQGTYTGLLFCGIPVYYLCNLSGLRICMVLTTIFFFASFFLLVFSFLKTIGLDSYNNLISSLLIAFSGLLFLLGSTDYDEIFFWYTGIAVYTIPICFLLLCTSFYLKNEHTPSPPIYISAIIFAFLAAGGALSISALLCSLLLLCILYNWIVLKKINSGIGIGVSALLGSIINTIAPGNFSRHTAFDDSIRPLTALHNTIYRLFTVLTSNLFAGFLLLLVVVSLICGIVLLRNSSFSFKYPVLITLYGTFGIIITDFPVILGYSEIRMPSRVTFVEYLAITIYTVVIFTYWGGWLSQNWNIKFNYSYVLLILFCLVPLLNYAKLYGLSNITPYKMIRHMYNGDFQAITSNELSIIEQLENSSDTDVIVYVNAEPDAMWSNIKRIELSEDPSYWVNFAVSQYYNKDSITLRYLYY